MTIAFGTPVPRGVPGQTPLWTEVDVTFDNSYPAAGYPVTPANVGFVNDVRGCGPSVVFTAGGVVILMAWDEATSKIRFFYPVGGATAAPATPAQPLLTAGGTTVTGSAATGPFTPGGGKEVPTGADLSGIGTSGLVKMMFYGS